MNDNGNHSKQYNADDIRRYLDGGMSSSEMHAIEKAALDDPFLSDAIDGYATLKDKEKQQAASATRLQLDAAFRSRISDKKKSGARVIGFKRWQTAAAAAIIITAGVLGYQAYDDKANSTILSETTDIVKQKSAAPIADSTTPPNPENFGSNPAAPAVASGNHDIPALKESDDQTSAAAAIKKETFAARQNKQKTPVLSETNKAMSESAEEAVTAKVLRNAVPREVENKTSIYPGEPADRVPVDSSVAIQQQPAAVLQGRVAGVAITKNRKTSQIDDTNYFNGQLLTPDNRPLSNAVLSVANDQKKYSTDNNGRFSIPSADSTVVVDVAMIGRDTQQFTLNRNPALNKLVLPESVAQLNDVVVVGYGSKRKRSSVSKVAKTTVNASPVGGWPAFEKYLSENKADSLVNTPPKTMRISFRVSAKNIVSDFVVINSISPAHDKEAIRLIRSGPLWQVIKGRKATVTIDIAF